MEDPEYTFGTSATAASRLEAIAEHFNPPAAELIQRFARPGREIAVDIGCGPGFSTDMLATAANCANTYGLDNSREFLDVAASRFPRCEFLEHDVTRAPFPVTADIMYARFVLCHLKNALNLVDLWMTQLKPEGLLFIDEIDEIETHLGVFRTYLSMAEGMIASQGACLFLGATLEAAKFDGLVLVNESVVRPVANSQAAAWFLPNTETVWKENEFARTHLGPSEMEAVRSALGQLKASKDSRSDITWRLRRLALQKPAE